MNKLIILCIFIASCSSGSMDVIDGFGPVGSKSYPIINGTPVAGMPEYGAVVGLHTLTKRYGGAVYIYPFCTGTLVTPSVVLTAAHCLDKAGGYGAAEPIKPNQVAVYVGDAPAELDENGDPDILNGMNLVGEVKIHPEYDKFSGNPAYPNDMGLLRLATDVTSVAPIGHLSATLGFTSSDVGILSLDLAGFGQDENGNFGVKLHANVPLNSLIGGGQIEHLHDPEGICFGDSGGPALVTRDVTTYVGGTASYVTSPYCANTGVHTRVDVNNSFIEDFVNPSTPPDSCVDLLPLGGSCVDDSECCSGKCKGKSGKKTCK